MTDRIDLADVIKNKSVALIGNSLSLFSFKYGAQIDSHDVVIRINKAAMLYTKFDAPETHGTKTTIWGVWDINTFDQEALKKAKKVIRVHVGTRDTGPLADYTISRDIIKELKSDGIRNPSSGLIFLQLLIKLEPSIVRVYGFDWKKTLTFTDTTKKDAHHTFPLEETYCREKIFTLPNFVYLNMIR